VERFRPRLRAPEKSSETQKGSHHAVLWRVELESGANKHIFHAVVLCESCALQTVNSFAARDINQKA